MTTARVFLPVRTRQNNQDVLLRVDDIRAITQRDDAESTTITMSDSNYTYEVLEDIEEVFDRIYTMEESTLSEELNTLKEKTIRWEEEVEAKRLASIEEAEDAE